MIFDFEKKCFIKFLFLFLFHFYHLSGFFLSPKWRSEERTGIVTCQLSSNCDTLLNTLLFSVIIISVFVKLEFRKVCIILAAWSYTDGVNPKWDTSLIHLNFKIKRETYPIKETSIGRLCLFISMFLEITMSISYFYIRRVA